MARQPLVTVQTGDRFLNQLQQNIQNAVTPVLNNPIVFGVILTNIALISGSTTINHTLGRNLQGWFIIRQRASATVYDTQDSNDTPQQTLLLTSSAAVTVDIYVF